MTAAFFAAFLVVAHLRVAKSDDLVVAVLVLDQDRKLLFSPAFSWACCTRKNFAGIADLLAIGSCPPSKRSSGWPGSCACPIVVQLLDDFSHLAVDVRLFLLVNDRTTVHPCITGAGAGTLELEQLAIAQVRQVHHLGGSAAPSSLMPF